MDVNSKINEIPAKLRLTSDVKQAQVCLDELLANIFTPDAKTNLESYLTKLPGDLPQLFSDIFLTTTVTQSTQNDYKKQIEQVSQMLNTCKIVQLTLAFKPDNYSISLFSDWIKKNIGVDAVIDLQYDRSIVGGVQIIYNGIYKDYSVRKNLASTFQLRKDEITGLLK